MSDKVFPETSTLDVRFNTVTLKRGMLKLKNKSSTEINLNLHDKTSNKYRIKEKSCIY